MELKASENRSPESIRKSEHASNETSDGPTGVESIMPVAFQTSDEIFKGLREVVIHHHGAKYRLRITASDKLILTK